MQVLADRALVSLSEIPVSLNICHMHLRKSLSFYHCVYQKIALVQAFSQSLELIHGPFWPTSGAAECLLHSSACLSRLSIHYKRLVYSFLQLLAMQESVLVVAGKMTDCQTAQKVTLL